MVLNNIKQVIIDLNFEILTHDSNSYSEESIALFKTIIQTLLRRCCYSFHVKILIVTLKVEGFVQTKMAWPRFFKKRLSVL